MALRLRDLAIAAAVLTASVVSAALLTGPGLPFAAALLLTSVAALFCVAVAYTLQNPRPQRDVEVITQPTPVVTWHPSTWYGVRHLYAPRPHLVASRVQPHVTTGVPVTRPVASRVQPHVTTGVPLARPAVTPSYHATRVQSRVQPHAQAARPNVHFASPVHTSVRANPMMRGR